MAKDHTVAYVSRIPNCDFEHTVPTPATTDGATLDGPWASMCDTHFVRHGIALGQGKGQRYILGEPPERTDADRQRDVDAAIAAGDLDAFFDACDDRDPMEFL